MEKSNMKRTILYFVVVGFVLLILSMVIDWNQTSKNFENGYNDAKGTITKTQN